MSNPTDTPSRRRVTVEQFDRIERKLDAVLSLLRGDQGRSGAASVRTLADGSTFVPGTGILGDPDAPRDLNPEAVAALEALDADELGDDL